MIIAESGLEFLPGLVQQYGGQITYQKAAQEAGKATHLIDPEQLKFKEIVDPYGLMNPGKSKVLQLKI